jgi:hypothetical protein
VDEIWFTLIHSGPPNPMLILSIPKYAANPSQFLGDEAGLGIIGQGGN